MLTEAQERAMLDNGDGAAWPYVLECLSMYRALRRSYLALSLWERDEIDASRLRFPGYHAETEARALRAAREIIEARGLFQESRGGATGDGLDALAPTFDGYRRMLDAWRPLRGRELLSRFDVQRILAAAVAPLPELEHV